MRFLGVDIGTSNIKVVELSSSDKGPVLENYGILETYSYLERPNAAIQTSYFKIVEKITADILKNLFREMKPKTNNAIFSLPIFSSFVTVFSLPLTDEKEIEKAIPFEAKKYIPMDLKGLEVDWAVIKKSNNLKKGKNGKSEILLVGISKELIKKYQNISKLAELDGEGFELESVAFARSLIKDEKEPIVIVDIGSQSMNIITIDNGYLVANENLQTAGAEITHVIARALGVSKERAEEFKRIKGFNVEPQEAEVINLMIPIIDYFGNEIGRALRIQKEKSGKNVKKIILAGGTANLPGLDKYLSDYLGLPVERAFPFANIQYDSFLEPLLREVGPILSCAVGLAMRELR
jgi:type IV pilus assembly protein PilM